MHENEDGTVLLTQAERRSLSKLLEACSTAISNLSSGEDFIGWENHYALGMWEDRIVGEDHDLSWYIEEEEEEDEDGDEEEDSHMKPTTVEQWLAAYGAEEE